MCAFTLNNIRVNLQSEYEEDIVFKYAAYDSDLV